MKIKYTLTESDLAKLYAEGRDLYVDGKRCTTRHSNRIIAQVSGARVDAASLVYYLGRGTFPKTLPQFLDGDKSNLAFDNLALSSCRTDRDFMIFQHERAQREEAFGKLPAVGHKYRESAGKVGRPRVREKVEPDAVPGRVWRKFRGNWVAVEPAQGVWDDFQVRALKVLEEGNYMYICPIKA